ncbi:VOC family protein [Nocardioides sp. W3-2-3]|uniref:VOC family protein n=1 Tax=Nocardioides convexus TaxID=2712224 RepID=UPI0024182CCB|nr:VOC family protein [Nocardioides convexus]NHA00388.1 VOC family protein [Nocardioides convexus]
MSPFWVSAFLDSAPEHHQEGVGFWQAATGYAVSAPRGDGAEFATLVPPDGDDFLRVQRLRQGPDRVHLDLHVTDPRAAADAAVVAGAVELVDRGYVVLASPGGLVFCFVDHPATHRPAATTHADGSASRVRQVAIDVPRAAYDVEWRFWAALTGWEHRVSTISEAFRVFDAPEGQPLGLLLQRLGEDDGPVRAHLDWGTTDRAAETERHLALGARVLAVHSHWTVLSDPVGRTYCLTDGDPR